MPPLTPGPYEEQVLGQVAPGCNARYPFVGVWFSAISGFVSALQYALFAPGPHCQYLFQGWVWDSNPL